MSRISKWKLEKTKVKVVFRLQFHATHIPQSGWDKLFISFIPTDSGKPTAKTTKTNVRNGTCKWADPIYETTRLLQDSKSKQYDEKLYKIVVAMVLFLSFSKSNGLSCLIQFHFFFQGSSRASTLGEATINLADYVDALKPSAVTLPLHGCNFGTLLHITIQLLTSKTGFREFEQQRELRERGLQSGVDSHGHGAASSKIPYSEDVANDQTDKINARIKFKADANELSSLEEEVNPNEEYAESATGFDGSSNTSGSLYAEKHEISSAHEIDSLKSTMSDDQNVLSHRQSPDNTVKGDPSDHQNKAHESTGSARGWCSDNSVDNELAMACKENNRLRGSLEIAESSLFNLKLEVSSLQSLADELGAETQKFSHLLADEISSSEELAKEVSVMKSECKNFKDDIIKLKDLKFSPQIPSNNQVDNLVHTVVEGKIRELLNKRYVVPHGGDSKFIYLELEALLNFLLEFKLGNVKDIGEIHTFNDEPFVSRDGLGLDLCPPESVLRNFNMAPPVSEVDAMKGQIFDLVRELDEAKVEKEALSRKMNQMECYYEAFIHELEENQKRMLGELQLLRNEHSTCLYTLSASKDEIETLHQDMNQQMLRFMDERRDLEAINEELERRATTSEAALRRARLNYSIAVDKLQKDLELLSSQVISMFETNENLMKQALPSQLFQKSEDDDVAKLSQFQNENSGLRKRSAGGGDILFEDLKRSFCMQEELYKKVEEELIEMYSINMNLDIYSKTLQESLREADAELKLSTASQDQLIVSLQKATDDIHALNEYKSSSTSRFSDMALQNQVLEDKLVSISEESYLLGQKLKDCESTMVEYRSYETKYAACLSENEKLLNEMSLLNEKLATLKAESDELVSSKENLEENVSFVQDKLANLLASYNEQFSFLPNCQSLNLDSMDVKDAVLRLEEVQHEACLKNCRLMEENQNLRSERAVADVSLSTVRSEILVMKQKSRSGLEDMVSKLDVSNALVDKLQAELESVTKKLHVSSEIEEKYAEQNKVLLADLARLEDQMHELTCKNGLLAQEISGLDTLAEEFERSKVTITELMHDKQELAMFLQDKTEESIKLSSEIICLKENLKVLHDELHEEKRQVAELMHVRELASDLESEKSRLARLLCQQNAFIEKLERNNSYQESELLGLHEYSLAADVKLIYVANQYEAQFQELVQKLLELQKRYHYTEAMLNHSLAGEANSRDEKANLLTSLQSLRSELEVSRTQNKLLSDQLEECERKLTMMETSSSENILEASEIERLKGTMMDAEEEISFLIVSNEELGISVLVLKDKIQEQSARIEEYKDELIMLRSQCNQLSHKLAEQVLKTEEFKNLSTHLKELKDKAEAECFLAREKRETEVAPATMQDSLRIAFIKEQYETKIQELKQQLSISKKHGEEMLLKLQDSIDEIENRKKGEAVNLKRNEEISLRLSALEEELLLAIAEKREKSKAYDRTKAELECALLSLECCKEEKDKLGASLLEFEVEKSQLASELTSVKGQLENLKSSRVFEKDEHSSMSEVEYALNGSTGNYESTYGIKRENSISILDDEHADSTECIQSQIVQDDATPIGMQKIPKLLAIEEIPDRNGKNLDVETEHLGAERLRSSMEHLHEELEKMKNENTVFDIGRDLNPGFQVPEREIMQLHKANEELKIMFPSYDEISSGGNALERVLALEIELAEAIKTKNQLNVQFQSSFLKQHSDEEAVFKSFKDINELIKEMLELKGRHAAMEAELRDMHDRYSQLSLQFAEVEGERQKLKMTLKNVRTSRKLVTLNRSSSANVMDLPSS